MLRKYGNFFPGAPRSKKQEIKRTIFLPSVEWRVVAVAVSQRISQKENQSKLSRLFVKTNPTPESVASFCFITCLFPFNLEYWKYQEYWKCNKVFKSSNILQECQYSHYWKNNLCDFSHFKMSENLRRIFAECNSRWMIKSDLVL